MKTLLNSRGGIMMYVLGALTISGLVVQMLMLNLDSSKRHQVQVQKSVDATLFVQGLAELIESTEACSNTLGFGYHTATSANFANDFDPTQRHDFEQPIKIMDPSGKNKTMYEAWSGDFTKDEPPVTALATPNLLIRKLALKKKKTEPENLADLGEQRITHDPWDTDRVLSEPMDVRSVWAELVVVLENFGGDASVFAAPSMRRTIDLALYTEKRASRPNGWKVLTCTPFVGQPTLPGWSSTGSTSLSRVTGNNDVKCEPGKYAVSVKPEGRGDRDGDGVGDGVHLTLWCAPVNR